ncbi:hypothetical protein C922_03079 [Plasmodium inui San Antonio 1]|uniref:Uncharacterized protein n=1 Tax=Plasmodium inui San Antonio 1 TaxID=1237626 RepID=W7A441_9APIC|nr:hypothetical protein C922_03079 [Plasmodium inui San Antonio 1]EUD66445.1 hypothetical protein C922_03079 [Plasmodium inui San Antonio 1]
MGYAHNDKSRNRNVSGSNVGHYLKAKGPQKNCKESKPIELYGQNVPYGRIFHAHNDVLLGGQDMGHLYRRRDKRTNNTYNYCREDGTRGNVEEVTYVFYEPLRYPAFKMADRRSWGGAENGDMQKDAEKRNRRDTSKEDKVVPAVDGQNRESPGGAKEVTITTANLTRVGKTKKAGECNSGVVEVNRERSSDNRGMNKQKSRDNVEVKNNPHSGDETDHVENLPPQGKLQREEKQADSKMKHYLYRDSKVEPRMNSVTPTGECNLSLSKWKREKNNFFIPITSPRLSRHPKEITNEVKFILHMTILTLYRDQIKPTYKKIRQRLGSFHQNVELKNSFLEICLSLQNEYLVVKSKKNNIFVLLRETPKWFSGWIKTRSFANPYPETMWRKFARHLLQACRAGAGGESPSPQSQLAVQFAKHLWRKGHLFFQSSDTLEGVLRFFGQDGPFGQEAASYDAFGHRAIPPGTAPHGEHAGSPMRLFIFNFLHDSFSYFSRVNDSVVRLVESSLVDLYRSILGDEEDKAGSGQAAISQATIGHAAIASEPPWKLDSDIYKAAEGLKKRGLPFLSHYSVGKIAHIVQLGLYSGLLHEEGQAIKPACCCKGVAASVWGGATVGADVGTGVGDKMDRKISSQVSSNASSEESAEVSGQVDSPPWSGLLTEEPPHKLNFRCAERQGPAREETKGGEIEEAPFIRMVKRHMEGEDSNAICSDADAVYSDSSLPCRDAYTPLQNGGGSSNAEKCDRVPLVPTAEDAKVKIDQLLKGSREKIVFFCSFKDKFFKKFQEVLNPIHFGCRSLIEFLFFHCQEVCKLFLLNRNVILVHPSCDEESVMDIVTQDEEDREGDGDADENIIEQFNYAEYVSSVTSAQKRSQTQQGNLQICTVLKNLGQRKKENFFITFSFWKCVTGKGKMSTR